MTRPPTSAALPAPLVAGPAGSPGAEDHHPLEPDVDHARALGEEPAEGRQADRHRQAQGERRWWPRRSAGPRREITRARLKISIRPSAIHAARRTGPPPRTSSATAPRCGGCSRSRGRLDGGHASCPPCPAASRRRAAGRPARPRGWCRRRIRWCAGGPPGVPLGRAERQPAGDLVGDDDGEHDRALDDRDHRGRDVGELQRQRRPVEEGEQQRRDGDAERVVAAQQGDRDAQEAEAGGELRACRRTSTRAAPAGRPGRRPRPTAASP